MTLKASKTVTLKGVEDVLVQVDAEGIGMANAAALASYELHCPDCETPTPMPILRSSIHLPGAAMVFIACQCRTEVVLLLTPTNGGVSLHVSATTP